MIKKKLAAIAAAAVAACSITATAFADTYDYYKFSRTLITGSVEKLPYLQKMDNLDGVVYVNSGLEGGNYFATFYIERYVTAAPATNEYDLWVNGRLALPYKSGQGVERERYRLVCTMEPQANAEQLYLTGKWAP